MYHSFIYKYFKVTNLSFLSFLSLEDLSLDLSLEDLLRSLESERDRDLDRERDLDRDLDRDESLLSACKKIQKMLKENTVTI